MLRASTFQCKTPGFHYKTPVKSSQTILQPPVLIAARVLEQYSLCSATSAQQLGLLLPSSCRDHHSRLGSRALQRTSTDTVSTFNYTPPPPRPPSPSRSQNPPPAGRHAVGGAEISTPPIAPPPLRVRTAGPKRRNHQAGFGRAEPGRHFHGGQAPRRGSATRAGRQCSSGPAARLRGRRLGSGPAAVPWGTGAAFTG